MTHTTAARFAMAQEAERRVLTDPEFRARCVLGSLLLTTHLRETFGYDVQGVELDTARLGIALATLLAETPLSELGLPIETEWVAGVPLPRTVPHDHAFPPAEGGEVHCTACGLVVTEETLPLVAAALRAPCPGGPDGG